MRLALLTAFAALAFFLPVHAQFGQRNTFSVFADYSNDSSHIILGQEENRKFAGAGVGYSLRLAHKRLFDFSYEAEVRPLYFVRDPMASGTSTVVVHNLQPGGTLPTGLPFNGDFNGPTGSECMSGTASAKGVTDQGVVYTQTLTQHCGDRWTYAGGMSPLGLRFGFLKRRRMQPYLVANGGFMVMPHDEPVNDSARFNFTFEGGGGIEWFRDHRHSFGFDYRVHHLSNGYRGFYNPGIDSGIFRVSYRFGQ